VNANRLMDGPYALKGKHLRQRAGHVVLHVGAFGVLGEFLLSCWPQIDAGHLGQGHDVDGDAGEFFIQVSRDRRRAPKGQGRIDARGSLAEEMVTRVYPAALGLVHDAVASRLSR
jgi:hypothetical protein